MSKESVIKKMKSSFENTIPTEIDHALNVLKNAEIIMDGEKIEGRERDLIEITAILHDIGMINAKVKYNNTTGPYQEKLKKLIDKNFKTKSGYKLASETLIIE
ncbi:HD domain-containing protein [Terrisporobacter vanillatitrophus]|uniref:HD domain-containing protein n=1 Tax=Terrisporobacter vanillatitrophus TaxID=3058402 RepID=UPI00336605FA